MSGINPLSAQHQKRKIILNADDYGPSPFCNQGIIEGILRGGINSVSAFVTFGPKCLENIQKLQEIIAKSGRSVKIGLHFTTTAGEPVAPIEDVNTLCFLSNLFNKHLFKNPDKIQIPYYWASQMEVELRAQLELLRVTLGLDHISDIDHINNHVGLVHFNRDYWRVYTDVAAEFNIPVRNPIPYHKIGGSVILTSSKPLPATKDAIKMLKRIAKRKHLHTAGKLIKGVLKESLENRRIEALRKNVAFPSYFVAHYYKQASQAKILHFLKELRVGETAEFMFHLGWGDHKKERHWGIQNHSLPGRTKELTELISSNILQELDAQEIELVHYSDLKK